MTFYQELLNDGPKRNPSNEKRNISQEQRQDGIRKFNANGTRGSRTVSIYYIQGKHSPETVVRTWLEENEHALEEYDTRSIHQRIARYGQDFKDASRNVFKERNEWEWNTGGESGGVDTKQVVICPFCEQEQRELPAHLPKCEQKP